MTEEARKAWGRVVRWLEENAPKNAAALSPPASQAEVIAAQDAIGVDFPQELRDWLMINNGVRAADSEMSRAHAHDNGCFLDSGWHLLSTELIVKVHERQMPSPLESPEDSPWQRGWIPFAAEADWMYGYFIDSNDGTVGSWGDYGEVEFSKFSSLSAFFVQILNDMQTIRTVTDGCLDCD
ncbi:SMI1/KNR4 family protein [Streptomyces sp. WAC04770]|nr:SMI1/KNR4 family protein [Streptomyces sp. WAC04770]RST24807.1 SMI1/KNR4 family protein [Streptomyces sp. WAC04770]